MGSHCTLYAFDVGQSPSTQHKLGRPAARHLRRRWAGWAWAWCRHGGRRWCWRRAAPACCSWTAGRHRAAWRPGCRRRRRGRGSRPPATIRARPSALRLGHRYVRRERRRAARARRGTALPPRPRPPRPPRARPSPTTPPKNHRATRHSFVY